MIPIRQSETVSNNDDMILRNVPRQDKKSKVNLKDFFRNMKEKNFKSSVDYFLLMNNSFLCRSIHHIIESSEAGGS
jgi:hypothetical protein